LRATIVRSAVELFVERGYAAVGMEDIAYASMCSRSTLNRYFGAKEDVLFPAVPEVIAGFTESALRRRYLEIAYEWEQILRGYFAIGLADDPTTHLRTQLLASAMVSALRAVLHAAVETGDDIATLADEAFGMLEAGVPSIPKAKRRSRAAISVS